MFHDYTKRKILAGMSVAALILLAGCGSQSGNAAVQNQAQEQQTQTQAAQPAQAQEEQASEQQDQTQVQEQQDQEQASEQQDQTQAQQAQQNQAQKQQTKEQKAQQAKASIPSSLQGVYAAYIGDEYLVGAITWQLSAEAQALMEQAFAAATLNVLRMKEQCQDPENADWEYDAQNNAMYYQGKRVAVISDIDDTLVQTASYYCDVVANYGDYTSASFARFVMSDSCVPCPGAVEFVNTCVENGIEVFYITNRSDLGYQVGKKDSMGSYAQAVGNGTGLYVSNDGQEIGASIYQCLGKSFYDITLESMQKLGFPIDDQHLILNDSRLKGSSKEPARQAIIQGSDDYPNGQREGENVSGSSLTATFTPHYVAMLLGDNLGDMTDAFYEDGLDAVSRAELASEYEEEFGTKWIVLPNAIYGASYSYASAYGLTELMEYYSYQ